MIIRTISNLFKNKAPVPYADNGPFKTISKRSNSGAGISAYGQVSTLFAIVNRLANDTSSVDWKLYQKSDDRRRTYAWDDMDSRQEISRKHPALNVLNKPNPFMTRQELFEIVQQHIDLTGEAFVWVNRDNPLRIPTELWPLKPTAIQIAVSDWQSYITGYVYKTQDGKEMPFEPDEIIHLRMPNPADMYRGMSPVTPLLVDLDSHRYASEYNRNFFLNDATPGGMIEYANPLSDDQFESILKRWNEQHKGVQNAHRPGIIEGGKWVSTAFSMRDIQFAELRRVSSDTIMEAFGFPKFKLGIVNDVNRANAEASEVMYAKSLLVPRLERIKQALNEEFLPMFGTTASNIEFDFCSPVPEDKEFEVSALLNRVNAATILSNAGYDPAQSLELVGLPPIGYSRNSQNAGGDQSGQDMVQNPEQGGPAN